MSIYICTSQPASDPFVFLKDLTGGPGLVLASLRVFTTLTALIMSTQPLITLT